MFVVVVKKQTQQYHNRQLASQKPERSSQVTHRPAQRFATIWTGLSPFSHCPNQGPFNCDWQKALPSIPDQTKNNPSSIITTTITHNNKTTTTHNKNKRAMLKRVAQRRKSSSPSAEASPTSSKENVKISSSEEVGQPPQRRVSSGVNQSISSLDHELLIKAAVARSKSSTGIFGRNRRGFTEEELSSAAKQKQPANRGLSRHHSAEVPKQRSFKQPFKPLDSRSTGSGSGTGKEKAGGNFEYREVVVNGKKKIVRVKKKSAAGVAAQSSNTHDGNGAGAGSGNRKLVKVKVKQVVKKHAQQQQQLRSSVPIKVGIPANHQLRNPSATTNKYNSAPSDNVSGVWSKAARSIFSFSGDKRSKCSAENTEMDLVFQPEDVAGGGGGTDDNDDHEGNEDEGREERARLQTLNNKTSHSNRSKEPKQTSRSKLSTNQLHGERSVRSVQSNKKKEHPKDDDVKNEKNSLTKNQTNDRNENNNNANNSNTEKCRRVLAAAASAGKPEFFARYVANGPGAGATAPTAADPDMDGPPMEIHTNAMTRTKTKSVYQSESVIRRQFIQDQWLSGGSNYQVWEKATINKFNDSSVVTSATEYTTDTSVKSSSGEEDYDDDVSEITHEDLIPEMLLEVPKQQDPLEQWEAVCSDRINRYGPRSDLTAESFVNRGIAQLQADRLEDAADSLLSAVCFLEEVHGTIDHNDRNGNGGAPSHMHMAQAFYFLGKVYMLQEQYPMAESAFSKALNIRQQHLGQVHPDTFECWEQIGLSYMQRASQTGSTTNNNNSNTKDNHNSADPERELLQRQAMDILSQVLKLKRATFGSLNGSVARTARAVANLCAIRDESERAQRLYNQVVNVLSKLDKEETTLINPDFPDPRDIVKQKQRKQELVDIEEEMRRHGLKDEILEI